MHRMLEHPCMALVMMWVALAGLTAGAMAQNGLSERDRACLSCHGRPEMASMPLADRLLMVAVDPNVSGSGRETRPELYVPADALTGTVHAGVSCVSCHPDASSLPHDQVLKPASCTTCHSQEQRHFEQSVHGQALVANDPDAPTCSSCHGAHDILPVDNRQSLTHPLNAVNVCADCHRHHKTKNTNGTDPEAHVNAYLESVHGRAVTRGGMVIAATCDDCHGHHDIHASNDPTSLVFRANVPDTCGQCHLGVQETYATSIHGKMLAQGNPDAPVCTDCHTGHEITLASIPESDLDIVAECGACHDSKGPATGTASFYETYRRSYHGQVAALGSSRAATCADCHGAHDILSMAEPGSKLFGDNLIDTCRECHPKANARFAQFDPHANFRDRDRNPVMFGVWWYFIIVMSAAFGFWGLHSVMWLGRSFMYERTHAAPHAQVKSTTHIRRFTRTNRVNHALVIVTFFGLTLTGMPLLFASQPWAERMINMFGGVHLAGILHRVFAVMLIINFVLHFISLFRSFRNRSGSWIQWLFGPTSMMPRKRDITDTLAVFRWFLRGGKKPTFDRWTYWEKFDYWAEIGGSMIIGGSGLLLWFPQFFSEYLFMPGWAYNVATIVHGFEALLAVGFIFTVHFFNAHLRPEKFPLDDVMFTGSLPEEEFRHERGAEFERLEQSGRLERLKVEEPAPWQRRTALLMGWVAQIIGAIIVILIILAALRWT
jgi:cytochrome b subunit of formate dehydrogenase